MVMQSQKRNGGEFYLSKVSLDPKPAKELNHYKSEGKFLVEYLKSDKSENSQDDCEDTTVISSKKVDESIPTLKEALDKEKLRKQIDKDYLNSGQVLN
jgi:hypothetical protein